MSIRASCQRCGGVFKAPDHLGGKRAKCPKCGGQILISEAPSPVSEILLGDADAGDHAYRLLNTLTPGLPESAPTPVRASSASKVETPRQESAFDQSSLVPCPDCGQKMNRFAEACPNCGRPFAQRPKAEKHGTGEHGTPRQ